MPNTTAYSMLNVIATINGLPVRGLAEGDDVIVVAQREDLGEMMSGADGSALFSQSADQSVEITLKLQSTSPTHAQLLALMKKQRAARLSGFPFTVIDAGNNEGGAADKCFIKTMPEIQKGKIATEREWVLVAGSWESNVTF